MSLKMTESTKVDAKFTRNGWKALKNVENTPIDVSIPRNHEHY